jgi:hypothetical protein
MGERVCCYIAKYQPSNLPDRAGLHRSVQYIFLLFPQTKLHTESYYLGRGLGKILGLVLEGFNAGYPDCDVLQETYRGYGRALFIINL